MKRLVTPLVTMVVLTGLVLAFLGMRPAELAEDTWTRLRGFTLPGVALAFVVYLTSYLGRAVRLAVLLPGSSSLVHLMSIAARHNLLNIVLPFRSGEVALPWMLKTEADRPLAEGSATLVVCRVLDLLCVAVYFTVGFVWWEAGSDTARAVAPRIAAVLAGLLLVLLLLRPVARLVGVRLAGRTGRIVSFLQRGASHVADLSRRRLALASLVSLATWAFTYGTFFVLLQLMDGPDPVGAELGAIDFPRSLVGSTGLHLSTVLPVNTPASVGIWEASWIFGYDLLADVGRQAAGISAVVSHLAVFGFITVIGGLGFLLRRRPEDGGRGQTP